VSSVAISVSEEEKRTVARISTAPVHEEHECAACHSREVDEWQGSLHRRAFTDQDFAASFASEPATFCFRCHAPEAKDRSDVAGANVGVGCRSCHEVKVEHASSGSVTTRSCGGCHEFTFPGKPALMQKTVTEHRASSAAETACATCHMANAGDGHRDHRFDVSRNDALLRSAIVMRASRAADGLEVDLETVGVGHAMPSGDLFCRLRVVVRAEADGRSLGEDQALLERRFERTFGAPREIDDTRVMGKRRLRFTGAWLGAAERIDVELRYERVAQTDHHERGTRETIFASTLLHQTVLGAREASR